MDYLFKTERRLALFWRLLIYLIGFFIMLIVVMQIIPQLMEKLKVPFLIIELTRMILYIGGAVGITRFQRLYVDRRPWSGIGLPLISKALPQLAAGLLLGFLTMGALFGVAYAANLVKIVGYEMQVSRFNNSLIYLLGGLVLFTAVGFGEEVMMRGYIFQNLGERYPIWLATIINGLIFGLLHKFFGFSLMLAVTAMIVTAFLVVARLSTNTLWLAIGWHIASDFAQVNIFGLDKSDAGDYGRALIHVEMQSPSLLLGTPLGIESGLLGVFIQLLGIVLLLSWASIISARLIGTLKWTLTESLLVLASIYRRAITKFVYSAASQSIMSNSF